ncbi:uncharacterized protein [Typha angustifolia]|uniref:uncharacterized protein n=1 Tax=Typha angustifolia TaxID=59011 RepID=UPI003C2BDFB8
MSRGQYQARTHSGRRATLGRCKRRESYENVVIIDVDNGKADFVVIDAPESSRQGSRCFIRTEKCSPSNIICIDDEDEGSDDTPRTMHQAFSNNSQNGLDSHESQMFVNGSSECSTSEVATSDCDSSDCEILDDTSGNIREQWEKAALRKKMSEGGQIGSEDRVSVSASSADPGAQLHETAESMPNLENSLNKSSEHFEEVPGEHSPSNSCNVKTNLFSGMSNFDELQHDILCGKTNDDCANSDFAAGICHERPGCQKEEMIPENGSDGSRFTDKNQFCYRTACSCQPENVDDADAQFGWFCSFGKNEHDHVGTSFCTSEVRNTSFMHKDDSSLGRPSSKCKGKQALSDQVTSVEKSCFGNQPTDGPQVNNGSDHLHKFEEGCLGEEIKTSCEGNAATGQSCCSTAEPGDKSQVQNDLAGEPEKLSESTANEDIPEVQNNLFGDREKHKESVEYRRAAEEEWASRQRQLQIQSEEAQRLRRRRKAESLRLLDMEKRQKQRLEEIRESQKKDEETINLKEQLRVEVRKELEKMEGKFRDMASLLRGLGIHVEGGVFPLAREVNAAYKQALRRFHPDRVSRNDIQQQVKAEETFKFISRLKEKLLPVA